MVPKISRGNAKIGKAWNMSLPPVTTCGDVPCAAKCYANGICKRRPNVRAAWEHNLQAYRENPAGYFAELDKALAKGKPRFFRWHVGGDAPDLDYLLCVLGIANKHPGTRFLIFTKRHHMVETMLSGASVPSNLSIVLSAWPGMPVHNPYMLPVAWCQDGTETRIPDDALECQGTCEGCGMCWHLRDLGRDVIFHLHR